MSDRRLRRYKQLPRALGVWALDSGGFTELSTHGTWDHGPTPAEYAARVRRYRDEIGRLMWVAPQDWMCEPFIVAKTGLSVIEHQRRTVANFVELRGLAPDVPCVPVLQGWTRSDYLACVQRYHDAGVDLTTQRLVGLGSVCRRQATTEVADIVAGLRGAGVARIHGFGVKTSGLRRYGHLLASADSLAWSLCARRQPPLPACVGRHCNCANCLTYALAWRADLLAGLDAAFQTQPVRPHRGRGLMTTTEHVADPRHSATANPAPAPAPAGRLVRAAIWFPRLVVALGAAAAPTVVAARLAAEIATARALRLAALREASHAICGEIDWTAEAERGRYVDLAVRRAQPVPPASGAAFDTRSDIS